MTWIILPAILWDSSVGHASPLKEPIEGAAMLLLQLYVLFFCFCLCLRPGKFSFIWVVWVRYTPVPTKLLVIVTSWTILEIVPFYPRGRIECQVFILCSVREEKSLITKATGYELWGQWDCGNVNDLLITILCWRFNRRSHSEERCTNLDALHLIQPRDLISVGIKLLLAREHWLVGLISFEAKLPGEISIPIIWVLGVSAILIVENEIRCWWWEDWPITLADFSPKGLI